MKLIEKITIVCITVNVNVVIILKLKWKICLVVKHALVVVCNVTLFYYEDISNQKFGKLTTIKYIGESKWLCECDCGNKKEVLASNLKMD